MAIFSMVLFLYIKVQGIKITPGIKISNQHMREVHVLLCSWHEELLSSGSARIQTVLANCRRISVDRWWLSQDM